MERNHQVRYMTSIYENASSVLICLGLCENEDIHTAIEIAKLRKHALDNASVQFSAEVETAIVARILQRDWFCRVWTKQELVVAKKAVVYIGRSSMNWDAFMTWVRHCQDTFGRQIVNRPAQTPFSVPLSEQFPASRPGRHWLSEEEVAPLLSLDGMRLWRAGLRPISLYRLLHSTRGAQASDPRDKVFALLGLSTSPKLEDFPPDYKLDAAEVCILTTAQLIKAEGNLRPLLRWSERTMCLPSWVPDYTSSITEFAAAPLLVPQDPIRRYSAHGFVHRSQKVSAHVGSVARSLNVRGIRFDIVHSVFDCNWWEIDEQRFQAERWALVKPNILPWIDRHEPLGSILTAGSGDIYLGRTSPQLHNLLSTWKQHLLTSGPEAQSAKREPILLDRCVEVMKARCVFMTSTGVIGIGPKDLRAGIFTVRPGDLICVLYGGEVPFVLRPFELWFELIGECYVSGIMHGEFMNHAVREDRWDRPGDQYFELR